MFHSFRLFWVNRITWKKQAFFQERGNNKRKGILEDTVGNRTQDIMTFLIMQVVIYQNSILTRTENKKAC
jgi:hypothetical protein